MSIANVLANVNFKVHKNKFWNVLTNKYPCDLDLLIEMLELHFIRFLSNLDNYKSCCGKSPVIYDIENVCVGVYD